MSRSQLSRTPANFPRMKHRAAGRLARKRALKETTPGFFEVFSAMLDRAFAGIIAMGEAFTKIVALPPIQSDFALVPAPAVFQDGLIPHPTIEGLRYDPAIVYIPTGDPVVDSAHRLTRATETHSLPQTHFLEGKP
jgi:hypothetical protein